MTLAWLLIVAETMGQIMKNSEKVRLNWAETFRELCNTYENPDDVKVVFLDYCKIKEKELNDKFRKGEKQNEL